MSASMKRIASLGAASMIALGVAVMVFGVTLPAGARGIPVRKLFNTGCVVARSPANGCFLTNVSGPVRPGANGLGVREGRACGWNVLMLFAWGDLRIETAKRDGGITEVTAVDNETFSIVPGFYGITKHCTVVSGR